MGDEEERGTTALGRKSDIDSNSGTDVLGACNFNERRDGRREARQHWVENLKLSVTMVLTC